MPTKAVRSSDNMGTSKRGPPGRQAGQSSESPLRDGPPVAKGIGHARELRNQALPGVRTYSLPSNQLAPRHKGWRMVIHPRALSPTDRFSAPALISTT